MAAFTFLLYRKLLSCKVKNAPRGCKKLLVAASIGEKQILEHILLDKSYISREEKSLRLFLLYRKMFSCKVKNAPQVARKSLEDMKNVFLRFSKKAAWFLKGWMPGKTIS